ncbi:MAG: hypothetical protein ABJC79_03945, partial [Acidimicrobiia bacterium]
MTATLDAPLPRAVAGPEMEAAPAPSSLASVRVPLMLIGLVVVGAWLRVAGLGSSRLAYDESFTAMAGRLSLGHLFTYLSQHDSHPPLDYLLRLPLARAGVSEFWFRLPSVICSVAALALFAWWMRRWGRIGILATALMAISSFEILHGRQARMYAETELFGVVIAMIALAWIVRPRRRLSIALGMVVFLAMMTHVSIFLLVPGLLLLAGRRTDVEAWWWRGAIVAAGAVWAALWGPAFLVQSRGGHSSWIPSTTFHTLSTAVARLVTTVPGFEWVTVAAIVVGGVLVVRRSKPLGTLWLAGFALPIALAALAGLFEPVVLDRTFTLFAWAPILAVAFAFDAVIRRSVAVGAVVAVIAAMALVPSAIATADATSGPNSPLRALERRVRPGDVVAVIPRSKAPELAWTLGVRHRSSFARVRVPGMQNAFGFQYRGDDPTG